MQVLVAPGFAPDGGGQTARLTGHAGRRPVNLSCQSVGGWVGGQAKFRRVLGPESLAMDARVRGRSKPRLQAHVPRVRLNA